MKSMNKLRSKRIEHYLYQAGKEMNFWETFREQSGLLLSIGDLQACLKGEVINAQEPAAGSQNPKGKGSNN